MIFLRAIPILAFTFLLLAPVDVLAADSLVPGVGSPDSDNVVSLNNNASQDWRLALESGRSYECTALGFGDTGSALDMTFFDSSLGALDTTTNSIKEIGNSTPPTANSSFFGANSRLTITPAVTGLYVVRVTNSSGTTATARIKCFETTLYGGFNTNANPFNFLEITNQTGAAISGKVRAINFDGTEALNTTFSVAANSRFDINIHGSVGSNKYGTLVVTHDGPHGALQSNLSQYATGLVLRATIPLLPREQLSLF